MLATFFPLPVLTLLGDVPPPPVPAGAPWWAQYLALLAPAFALWLFSQGVDALNAVVKKRDAEGIETSGRVRFVLMVLNAMAGNILKGKRVVGVEAEAAKEAKP